MCSFNDFLNSRSYKSETIFGLDDEYEQWLKEQKKKKVKKKAGTRPNGYNEKTITYTEKDIGLVPIDIKVGFTSSAFSMKVRIKVYDGKLGVWFLNVSAIAYSTNSSFDFDAGAKATLYVNNRADKEMILKEYGTNIYEAGAVYVGEALFDLPEKGNVLLKMEGHYIVISPEGRFSPVHHGIVQAPIGFARETKINYK